MNADCVIIGAGPAGLTAAWELDRLGKSAIVFEQDSIVGGLSRTCEFDGYRLDIGGHRFFTKIQLVQNLWEEILDEELLVRPRLSRIYYNGRFFDYPLQPMNAFRGLGLVETARILGSYARARLFPSDEERSFEQWVTNRFGRRLYEVFFKAYTEKVWGIPCSEISADWAAQRIKDLDLWTALRNVLLGSPGGDKVITTLIDQFHYPRLGPGQMWEHCTRKLEARGVPVRLDRRIVGIRRSRAAATSVLVQKSKEDADVEEVRGDHFISTMPIRTLLRAMEPQPPREVLDRADQLRYRDFLVVALVVDKAELFPDNWIYIHAPEVKVGRIQNVKNWSPDMVPDPSKSLIALEYFVQKDDDLWTAPDEELLARGRRECAWLGLLNEADVVGGTVVRMPKAYPVYDANYSEALRVIREWLDQKVPNLLPIGRNGQHRYNNQDHSMLTGVYAARNIAAGRQLHDLWSVNVDGEYHEELSEAKQKHGHRLAHGSDRSAPEHPVAPGPGSRLS